MRGVQRLSSCAGALPWCWMPLQPMYLHAPPRQVGQRATSDAMGDLFGNPPQPFLVARGALMCSSAEFTTKQVNRYCNTYFAVHTRSSSFDWQLGLFTIFHSGENGTQPFALCLGGRAVRLPGEGGRGPLIEGAGAQP